jgi:aryl-alcohol dehydrogenase (NADP+)
LGGSGLKVSRLCLGTLTFGSKQWRDYILPENEARPFYERALESGINFFDTANVYSDGVSEEVTGRALRDLARREEYVLATKVCLPVGPGVNQRGLSRKHIMDSIDASLRRLGMDYVDLYQIHRWDPSTPIQETLRALDDLVSSGKVRYLGASTMSSWQFCQALYTADLNGWSRFVSMQNHYNLVYREEEREMIPLCMDQGIGVIPWSPLARGFLAGNRTRDRSGDTARSRSDNLAHDFYYSEGDFQVVDAVERLAGRKGCAAAQIALSWILHKPGVTAPIVGVTRLEHLDQAIEALKITLTEEEMAELEAPYTPHPVAG